MDDVLTRLGAVESSVAELRSDVRHLATKAELSAMETRLVKALGDTETRLVKAMGDTETRLVKAIGDMDTRLSAQIASMDGRILRWLVATVIASIGAAATVAKLLN